MPSLNKCIFIGNITKNPEIKYMSNGDAVTNFSIAINESWKDKQGIKQEKTEFINIVMYRKLAEIAGKYLKKGSPVYIEGKLQTRKWEKDGVTRYSTEVIADSMQMLGTKGAQSDDGDSSAPATQNNAPQAGKALASFDDFEDDIPF